MATAVLPRNQKDSLDEVGLGGVYYDDLAAFVHAQEATPPGSPTAELQREFSAAGGARRALPRSVYLMHDEAAEVDGEAEEAWDGMTQRSGAAAQKGVVRDGQKWHSSGRRENQHHRTLRVDASRARAPFHRWIEDLNLTVEVDPEHLQEFTLIGEEDFVDPDAGWTSLSRAPEMPYVNASKPPPPPPPEEETLLVEGVPIDPYVDERYSLSMRASTRAERKARAAGLSSLRDSAARPSADRGDGMASHLFEASSLQTHEVVLLKKWDCAFASALDAQRTYRELMYLRALEGHENMHKCERLFLLPSVNHAWASFEFVDSDVAILNAKGLLGPIHKQHIVYQSLKALVYVHSAGLMLRDLRPSSLLVQKLGDAGELTLKLTDVGLACPVDAYTAYEEKRIRAQDSMYWLRDGGFWRAPEVLMYGAQTQAVDMWSLGCIIAELFSAGGKPFLGGSLFSNHEQLLEIVRVLGPVTETDIKEVKSEFASDEDVHTWLPNGWPKAVVASEIPATRQMRSAMLAQLPKVLPRPRTYAEEQAVHCEKMQTIAAALPEAPPEVISLLKPLLNFGPKHRMPLHAALQHSYVAQVRAFVHPNHDEPLFKGSVATWAVLDETKLHKSDAYFCQLQRLVRNDIKQLVQSRDTAHDKAREVREQRERDEAARREKAAELNRKREENIKNRLSDRQTLLQDDWIEANGRASRYWRGEKPAGTKMW